MNLDERLQKDLSPDIYCLVHNKIVNLEQQYKKQKKVIDKAIEYIKRKDICIDIRKTDGSLDYVSTNELLQILEDKEVSE